MSQSSEAEAREQTGRPAGENERCIWMTAGVLSYWLCPRNFACDSCPVDHILSGREVKLGEPAEDVLHLVDASPLAQLRVPIRRRGGLHFHPAHLWGREIEPGRIRLGLDDVAARLSEDSEGWSLPAPGKRLSEGDWLAQTQVEGIEIRVASPFAGQVLSRNDAIRSHPALVTWSPYDAGWLLEMGTEAELSVRFGFMRDEGVVQGWFEAELDRLAACQMPPAARTVRLGPTLQDGGVPLSTLREILGPEGHKKAIRTFWCVGLR